MSFLHGELPPEEVARVGLHLADCRECASAAARSIDVSRSAASLRDDFGDHLHGDEIVAYVDGSASNGEAVRAAEHVADCEACRRDVADLRAFRRRHTGAHSPSWRKLTAIAAAVVLAIVIAFAVLRRHGPAAPRQTTTVVDRQRVERDALVREALRDGIAKPAVLAGMAQPGETLRGVASGERPQVTEPIGVVIEDPRPLFRWRNTGGASINLSIFSEGRTVVRTLALHGDEWRPTHALERGKVYRWQIEVTTARSVMIAPGPSEPPAMFAVLSEDQQRALDTSRARFAHDDLYLGVLTARDGLQETALDHLRRYSAAHPGELDVANLLRAVESWRSKM